MSTSTKATKSATASTANKKKAAPSEVVNSPPPPSTVSNEKPPAKKRAPKAQATATVAASSPAPVSVPENEQKEDFTQQQALDVTSAALDVIENEALLASLNAEYLQELQLMNQLASSLKLKYKQIEKVRARVYKASCKKHRKRPKDPSAVATTRSPSGFVKPTPISNELALFLGKPIGSEMARTDVTKEINGYIRLNQLQDKENGRVINADAKLATLLKIGLNEELTYFNLQKYMSHHFAKKDKTTGEMMFAH
jgi:chromatin remodeling complex protein RSC6